MPVRTTAAETVERSNTGGTSAASAPQMGRHNRLIDLLIKHQVVFGWAAPSLTPETARRAALDSQMDAVFIDMSTPDRFAPAALRGFREAMLEAGLHTNPNTHPFAVRLPRFHDDPAAAGDRVATILNLGAHAIAFPGVDTRDRGAQAIASLRFARSGTPGTRPPGGGEAPPFWGMSDQEYEMRADAYPLNPIGELAAIVSIDSEMAVRNIAGIAAVRPTVIMPDVTALLAAMTGGTAGVETALQTVLAACKASDVACGIGASASDVEQRIKEGFRLLLLDDAAYAAAIALGRRAAGRR